MIEILGPPTWVVLPDFEGKECQVLKERFTWTCVHCKLRFEAFHTVDPAHLRLGRPEEFFCENRRQKDLDYAYRHSSVCEATKAPPKPEAL